MPGGKRRTVGRSVSRQRGVYWFAREGRKVIARADSPEELTDILLDRDTAMMKNVTSLEERLRGKFVLKEDEVDEAE